MDRDIVLRLRDWLGGKWAIDRCMDDDMAEAAVEIERLRQQRGTLAYSTAEGWSPLGETIVRLEAEVARLRALLKPSPDAALLPEAKEKT